MCSLYVHQILYNYTCTTVTLVTLCCAVQVVGEQAKVDFVCPTPPPSAAAETEAKPEEVVVKQEEAAPSHTDVDMGEAAQAVQKQEVGSGGMPGALSHLSSLSTCTRMHIHTHTD